MISGSIEDGLPLQPAQLDMAEALPQIVWTADPDGTVDWVNSAFQRYSGLEDISLPARDWLLAVHPDDREPTLEAWAQAIASGRTYRTEFRIWCASEGVWRTHLVNASPHHDPEGRILRWFGLAIDIQEQRDADMAREVEATLRTIESRTMEQVSTGTTQDVILHDICLAMGGIIDGARAAVALLGDDGARLEHWHAANLPTDWLRAMPRLPVVECARANGPDVHLGAIFVVADITQEPHFQDIRQEALEQRLAACWSLPVHDAEGRVIACFTIFHEQPGTPTDAESAHLYRLADLIRIVIDHVRARDRQRVSEQRYRSLFNLLPIGIFDSDVSELQKMLGELRASGVTDLEAWLDANDAFLDQAALALRLLDANRAALELHGVDDREELAQNFVSMVRDSEARASLRGMLLALFDGAPDYETLHSIPRRDGRHADVLVRMLLPESGNSRLLITQHDITKQRRAEERFRQVAQASSDYIFDRDFTSETTWVNDASTWLADFPAGPCEVPRSAWVNSVHPEDSHDILNQIDRAVSGGDSSWGGEYRLRLSDGSYIPVRERSSIIRDSAGEPVRMVGSIVDLSEQKTLEAQLHQSQRLDAVGQLTGGIAHDFNNLLTVIQGNAEMLRDALPTRSGAATMAEHVLAASERAANLTQHLLAFARKQPLVPGHFDPNTMVEGMQVLIERSITPAITLELDLATALGSVHVDRAMFENALLNLCVNARDAMPQGGTLRIESRLVVLDQGDDPAGLPAGKYVRITVSDTGTGMDADTMTRAFEPFFTTKRVGEGSGLGLSMVYGFVHQSEGHIRIRSVSGAGSAIEILLPQSQGDADGSNAEQTEQTLDAARAPARILIVEDETLVREYITTTIETLGYRALALPRAAPALELLKAGERFDLLLSDIVMPGGMNGRQLAEAALTLYPDMPILLISGHSEEMAAPDGRIDPRIGFLRKPFRKHELASRLAEQLFD